MPDLVGLTHPLLRLNVIPRSQGAGAWGATRLLRRRFGVRRRCGRWGCCRGRRRGDRLVGWGCRRCGLVRTRGYLRGTRL